MTAQPSQETVKPEPTQEEPKKYKPSELPTHLLLPAYNGVIMATLDDHKNEAHRNALTQISDEIYRRLKVGEDCAAATQKLEAEHSEQLGKADEFNASLGRRIVILDRQIIELKAEKAELLQAMLSCEPYMEQIKALRSQLEGMTKALDLTWHEVPNGMGPQSITWEARQKYGDKFFEYEQLYKIGRFPDNLVYFVWFTATRYERRLQDCSTLEEAKLLAKNHWHGFIRAALTTQPQPAAGMEGNGYAAKETDACHYHTNGDCHTCERTNVCKKTGGSVPRP